MCARYIIPLKILYRIHSLYVCRWIEIGQGRLKNCQDKRVKIPKHLLLAILNNLPSESNKLHDPAAR